MTVQQDNNKQSLLYDIQLPLFVDIFFRTSLGSYEWCIVLVFTNDLSFLSEIKYSISVLHSDTITCKYLGGILERDDISMQKR